MNPADALRAVRDLLPAGEWSAVTPTVVEGMMTSRGMALFGRTDELRSRTKCFFKFIPAARDSAGASTAMITGAPRLETLATRLRSLQSVREVVPVRLVRHEDPGLLVVMEEVEQLDGTLREGRSSIEARGRGTDPRPIVINRLASLRHLPEEHRTPRTRPLRVHQSGQSLSNRKRIAGPESRFPPARPFDGRLACGGASIRS